MAVPLGMVLIQLSTRKYYKLLNFKNETRLLLDERPFLIVENLIEIKLVFAPSPMEPMDTGQVTHLRL